MTLSPPACCQKGRTLKHVTTVVIVLSVLASTSQARDVYRWTDERGQVHFGDRPPPNAKARSIGSIKPSSPTPKAGQEGERKERQRRLLKAFEKERLERAEQRTKAAAKKKEDADKCSSLTHELYNAKGARYLYREKGSEREVLSQEERTRYLEGLQRLKSKHCRR